MDGGHTREIQDLKWKTVIKFLHFKFSLAVCIILGLDLQPGAAGFQLTNPPVLETVNLLASLNVSNCCILYIQQHAK